MVNLSSVYFLEYMCLSCFADQFTKKLVAKYPERRSEWAFTNGYEIFAFSYQIGVFISRSSLSIIKIKQVEIMTIL